ncbi:hypothetical protein ASZ78_009063 [Callipepla squamata]|uniref:Plasmolipin n=1 Tax=Callipepla squamata TaxID=9009 RepID=A0A226MTB2_CALSU|nr:hypothetical protein ASZ78_009063 [Callipepla squamata]
MAGLPGAAGTRSSSPGAAATLPPPRLDEAFLCSPLGGVMGAQAVSSGAERERDSTYGWVLFVSIFLWIVTVLLFVMYLLQLPKKFYAVPWSLMLMIFNAVATVLYVAAFVTCSAAVRPTSWRQWDYNRRAAASFFAGLVMLTYGVGTFFSFRAWKGLGSNAASSQAVSHA